MILFSDLDETLLNEDSLVSDYTKEVLTKWNAAGHRLALSSGRPLDSILQVKEHAGLNFPGMYVIANNGALVYDCDRQEAVRALTFPTEWVDHLQKEAKEMGIHIQTYTEHAIISEAEDEEIRFYRQRIRIPLILSSKLSDALEHDPYKMLAIHLTDHELLEQFRTKMAPWAEGKLQMIFSTPRYLEIFSGRAGKGSAVTWLCDYLRIPIEESYAAGDQANDISMLEAAGCGIAMCNGTEEIRQAADVVTQKSNRESGLAEYLMTLL